MLQIGRMFATLPTLRSLQESEVGSRFGSMERLDVNIDTLVTGLVIMGIGYHHLLLTIVSTKAWLLPYFHHLVHRQTWLEFSR